MPQDVLQHVPDVLACAGCRFLETWAWKCTMIAMLMFVLFVPDILALAGATNAADPAINALLLLCMATFLAELGANVVCRPGYTLLEVGVCPTSTQVAGWCRTSSATPLICAK